MPRLSGAPAYNRTAQSHPFLIVFITEYDNFVTKRTKIIQLRAEKSWIKIQLFEGVLLYFAEIV